MDQPDQVAGTYLKENHNLFEGKTWSNADFFILRHLVLQNSFMPHIRGPFINVVNIAYKFHV